MFYSISSPYQVVFHNDRVCGTREQMMLQVNPVRPIDRVGIDQDYQSFDDFTMF